MAKRTDDDEFERAMETLGAKPVARQPKRGAVGTPSVLEDLDFDAAMRELPDASRPAKKAPAASAPTVAGPSADRPVADDRRFAPSEDERMAFLEAMGDVVVPSETPRTNAAPPAAIDVEALLRRVRRGQVEPEASLDLHGRTRAQALADVQRFVADARAEKWRVVRVVVGKGLHSEGGDAVVGPTVERWLADGPALEVVRAPAHLGGHGALVVVLRLE